MIAMLRTIPLGVKLLGGAILGYGAVSVYKKRQANQATNHIFGNLSPDVQVKVTNAIDSIHDDPTLRQLGDGLAKVGALGAAVAAHEKAGLVQYGVKASILQAPSGAAVVAAVSKPATAKLNTNLQGMTMGVGTKVGIFNKPPSTPWIPTPTITAPIVSATSSPSGVPGISADGRIDIKLF